MPLLLFKSPTKNAKNVNQAMTSCQIAQVICIIFGDWELTNHSTQCKKNVSCLALMFNALKHKSCWYCWGLVWGSRCNYVRTAICICWPTLIPANTGLFSIFLLSRISLLAEMAMWALPNPGQAQCRGLFKNGWLGATLLNLLDIGLGNGQQPPHSRWLRAEGHSHIWKRHIWI